MDTIFRVDKWHLYFIGNTKPMLARSHFCTSLESVPTYLARGDYTWGIGVQALCLLFVGFVIHHLSHKGSNTYKFKGDKAAKCAAVSLSMLVARTTKGFSRMFSKSGQENVAKDFIKSNDCYCKIKLKDCYLYIDESILPPCNITIYWAENITIHNKKYYLNNETIDFNNLKWSKYIITETRRLQCLYNFIDEQCNNILKMKSSVTSPKVEQLNLKPLSQGEGPSSPKVECSIILPTPAEIESFGHLNSMEGSVPAFFVNPTIEFLLKLGITEIEKYENDYFENINDSEKEEFYCQLFHSYHLEASRYMRLNKTEEAIESLIKSITNIRSIANSNVFLYTILLITKLLEQNPSLPRYLHANTLSAIGATCSDQACNTLALRFLEMADECYKMCLSSSLTKSEYEKIKRFELYNQARWGTVITASNFNKSINMIQKSIGGFQELRIQHGEGVARSRFSRVLIEYGLGSATIDYCDQHNDIISNANKLTHAYIHLMKGAGLWLINKKVEGEKELEQGLIEIIQLKIKTFKSVSGLVRYNEPKIMLGSDNKLVQKAGNKPV